MKKLLSALVLLAVAGSTSAGVIWSFTETGGNVVGTMSGSIDTTGLDLIPLAKPGPVVVPHSGLLFSGPAGGCSGQRGAFTSVSVFGPGGLRGASATTGDPFVISASPANILCLPLGYTSGAPLSGTLTFASATFSSVGMTPGTYVDTLPHDTVTLRFGVPEPATLALLGIGFAGLGFSRRSKLN